MRPPKQEDIGGSRRVKVHCQRKPGRQVLDANMLTIFKSCLVKVMRSMKFYLTSLSKSIVLVSVPIHWKIDACSSV